MLICPCPVLSIPEDFLSILNDQTYNSSIIYKLSDNFTLIMDIGESVSYDDDYNEVLFIDSSHLFLLRPHI